MSNVPYSDSDDQSLEGAVLRPTYAETLAAAVDLAFDYRGDVSLALHSGEIIVGYVYSRDATVTKPILTLFPVDGSDARVVPYEEILSIHFSGEDTASGKSWEAWVNKKQEEEHKKPFKG